MNLLSAYILIEKGYRTYKDKVPVHRELESSCQEQTDTRVRIAGEIARAEERRHELALEGWRGVGRGC